MRLQEVMTKTVRTIPATATAQEAARLMEIHNIGFLPVIQDEISAGVVTDRDLAIQIVAGGRDPAKTTVAEIMSFGPGVEGNVDFTDLPGVATLPQDADVQEAIRVMDEKHIRRIMVHDENYRIVGVVSRADLPSAESLSASLARSEE